MRQQLLNYPSDGTSQTDLEVLRANQTSEFDVLDPAHKTKAIGAYSSHPQILILGFYFQNDTSHNRFNNSIGP